jgi:hypothetical protein
VVSGDQDKLRPALAGWFFLDHVTKNVLRGWQSRRRGHSSSLSLICAAHIHYLGIDSNALAFIAILAVDPDKIKFEMRSTQCLWFRCSDFLSSSHGHERYPMTTGALVSLGEIDDKEKWCVIPVMRDNCLALKLTVSKPACENGCTGSKLSYICTERP